MKTITKEKMRGLERWSDKEEEIEMTKERKKVLKIGTENEGAKMIRQKESE